MHPAVVSGIVTERASQLLTNFFSLSLVLLPQKSLRKVTLSSFPVVSKVVSCIV